MLLLDGLTARHAAAEDGQHKVVKQLLDSGADIEAKDDAQYTPLMYAMQHDQCEVVVLLTAKGAIIGDGRAVRTGAMYGSIAALKTLMTSTQWLAMSRTERIHAECRLLASVKDTATLGAIRSLVLDMSALTSWQDEDAENALHLAACDGKAVPLICAIVKEGVDPTAKNSVNQTPADVAHEKGHTLQATLLNRAADDKRKRDLKQQQQQQEQQQQQQQEQKTTTTE